MSRIALLLLISNLLSCVSVLGQGYYPLAIGDRWDFGEYDYPGLIIYEYSYVVTAETTMSNGKTYAIRRSLIHGMLGSGQYIRQEGPLVYQLWGNDESVIMDFSLQDGDTIDAWTTGSDSGRTIVHVGEGSFLGRNLRAWNFQATGTGFYEPAWWTIIDSVGPADSWHSPGARQYLMGAIIGGVVYGTITAVDPGHATDRITPESSSVAVFPNPFNSTATAQFSLTFSARVTVTLYDVRGALVQPLAEGDWIAGNHTMTVETRNLSSGVYFLRFTAIPLQVNAQGFTKVERIVLLR